MKALNILFVVIFMFILILPLASVDLSDNMISEKENRMLAEKPTLTDIWNTPTRFISEFDSWFPDHVGFRELMISLNERIERWSGESHFMDGSFVVLVGEQGHHYNLYDGRSLAAYQGKRWLSDEQSGEMAVKLEEIRNYLEQKDIGLIVMFTPTKESIYPEYYPESVISGPAPIPLDVLTGYLAEHTEIDLFSVKERFMEAKADYLLFPKVGDVYALCHYNETGAFIAYRELMKHITAYYPNIKPYTMADVNIEYAISGSSSVTLKEAVSFERVASEHFADAMEFVNQDSSLPTLLMLRDSFADWFPNYLPQHFAKTVFLPWDTMEHLQEYIDFYKPDVVVFEVFERTSLEFAEVVANYSLP